MTPPNGRHLASGGVRCAASVNLRTVATEYCSDGLYTIYWNSPVREFFSREREIFWGPGKTESPLTSLATGLNLNDYVIVGCLSGIIVFILICGRWWLQSNRTTPHGLTERRRARQRVTESGTDWPVSACSGQQEDELSARYTHRWANLPDPSSKQIKRLNSVRFHYTLLDECPEFSFVCGNKQRIIYAFVQ